MKNVNNEKELDEHPEITSRYSLVIATAKRARQLINGAEPLVDSKSQHKPLSVAIQEFYEGKVKILTDEEIQKEGA